MTQKILHTISKWALVIGALMMLLQMPAQALSTQQEIIEKARLTFLKLVTGQDFKSLPDYVKKAKAILIFPSLIKGGFIIGAEGGTGVLLVRDDVKGWSDPAFYTLASGSVGLQIGGQVSEVVFTIMTPKGLEAIIRNQFKFGGSVSVAAGPVGIGVGTSSSTNLKADVYSFASSVGLFGGISFDGAGVLARESLNTGYYGKGATTEAILVERRFSNPEAKPLKDTIIKYSR